MIFLHGANSAGTELQPFVEAMQPYATVRTPNMAGHGGRPIPGSITMRDVAADLVAWMDQQGIERDVVGGYSLGATVALYIARHYPQRVSGVVALAAKHVFDARTLEHWQHLLGHERVERTRLPDGTRRVDELIRLHAPNPWKDVLDANSRLFATFAADPPLPEADLKAIRAPVIIVSSNLDPIVPGRKPWPSAAGFPMRKSPCSSGPRIHCRTIPLLPVARTIHQWMAQHQLA